MNQLIEHLIQSGVLKTERIIEAFRAIDRADFVLPEYKGEAYGDYPLPIGYSQTISQPYTVAFMLELLRPEPGNKIMDVGAGSGWTTALLAYIVSASFADSRKQNADQHGKVIGVEVMPELAKFGEENIQKYNFIEKGIAEIRAINAENGFPDEAPFDGILAGAAAQKVPAAWKEQLAPGGRIVMPIGSSVYLLTKTPEGAFEEKEYPGFVFVPFVSKGTK